MDLARQQSNARLTDEVMRLLDGLATLSESGASEIKPLQEDSGHARVRAVRSLESAGACNSTSAYLS